MFHLSATQQTCMPNPPPPSGKQYSNWCWNTWCDWPPEAAEEGAREAVRTTIVPGEQQLVVGWDSWYICWWSSLMFSLFALPPEGSWAEGRKDRPWDTIWVKSHVCIPKPRPCYMSSLGFCLVGSYLMIYFAPFADMCWEERKINHLVQKGWVAEL